MLWRPHLGILKLTPLHTVSNEDKAVKKTSLLNVTSSLLMLFSAALFWSPAPAQASVLTGDTVTCGGTFTGIFCSPATATVGSSVEFTLGLGGVAPQTFLSLDFGATDLTITALGTTDWASDGDVLRFSDITNAFPSATLVSSTATTFGAGNITLAGGV